jgi:hypothetical protein
MIRNPYFFEYVRRDRFVRRYVTLVLLCFFPFLGISQDSNKAGGLSFSYLKGAGEKKGGANAHVTVMMDKPFVNGKTGFPVQVSPQLYGLNWATWLGLNNPASEAAKPLNLRVIRLGGGQLSRYNWRTGKLIEPGQTHVERPYTSIDAFVEFCRRTGAEPLIQVNALGWAPDPQKKDAFGKCMTVQDAADLVVYLNETKKYGVKYFEIDNEYDIWHEINPEVWDHECTIEAYTEIYKKFAYAMKKAQSQIGSPEDIKIFGPVICKAWNFPEVPKFLKACKEFERDRVRNPEGYRILDVLSFHYYPLFRTDFRDLKSFIPGGIPAMLESVQTWWNPSYVNRYDHNQPLESPAATLLQFRDYIDDYFPGLKLAVTEFGVDSAPGVNYDPRVRPMYLADLLGVMAKHGVEFVMPGWVKHNDPVFGLLDTANRPRPHYYPFLLYSQHFEGTVLTADSDRSDLLNVYACKNTGGDVVIMLVNKDAADYNVELDLVGYKGRAVKPKVRIQSEKYSLTCIRIPAGVDSQQASVWVYGERQMQNRLGAVQRDRDN